MGILRIFIWAGLIASITSPTLAIGAEVTEDSSCLPLFGVPAVVNANDVSAGRVVGRGPVKLLSFLPVCGKSPTDCNRGSPELVASGTAVIITKSASGYDCIQAASRRRGGIGGWIPAGRVLSFPRWPNLPSGAWVGKWTTTGAEISISSEPDGRLRFYGNATYQARTQVNSGSFDDRVRPVNGRVDLSSGAEPCSVSMGLIEGLLAVFDQGDCDGNNVSFTGVYVRQMRSK